MQKLRWSQSADGKDDCADKNRNAWNVKLVFIQRSLNLVLVSPIQTLQKSQEAVTADVEVSPKTLCSCSFVCRPRCDPIICRHRNSLIYGIEQQNRDGKRNSDAFEVANVDTEADAACCVCLGFDEFGGSEDDRCVFAFLAFPAWTTRISAENVDILVKKFLMKGSNCWHQECQIKSMGKITEKIFFDCAKHHTDCVRKTVIFSVPTHCWWNHQQFDEFNWKSDSGTRVMSKKNIFLMAQPMNSSQD